MSDPTLLVEMLWEQREPTIYLPLEKVMPWLGLPADERHCEALRRVIEDLLIGLRGRDLVDVQCRFVVEDQTSTTNRPGECGR